MATFTSVDREYGLDRPLSVGRILLRLALFVVAPVLLAIAVEGALRMGGVGRPTEFFIPDGKSGFYRANPDFTAAFIPASFGIQPLNFRIRMHKEPGTVRVFVLGESAAQGAPEPDFGFAAQLRAQLTARFPGKPVEVFNLGIAGINSHVAYRIVRDVRAFEPDLLVVYMGENEVTGPYGPGCAYLSANQPLWYIRSSVWVRSTRTGQILTQLLGKLARSGFRAQNWRGMETFSNVPVRGGDPRLDAVYRNFSANLQDIVGLAGRAGIRTVVCTMVPNLRDSAPFMSVHRAGLSPEEEGYWNQAFESGTIAWDLGDVQSAVYGYGEALRIDAEFAETHFRLGRLAETLGKPDIARKRYLDALHWDALRLRPDERLNGIMRQVAQGAGRLVLLVDAAKAMGADPESRTRLSGHEILFDHVHLNWDGNFQLAWLLADACARELPGPDAGPSAGLGSEKCAAALGYTPDAQLAMLQAVVQRTQGPPFASQSTFSEDQARLKAEAEHADALLKVPGAGAADLSAVERALLLDPGSAPLAVRLAGMESAAGNQDRALLLLDQAATLQPPSPGLSVLRARVLVRLTRFDEAEALLREALESDGDSHGEGGALADLWVSTGQFERARQFFVSELGKAPENRYLRLEFADLLARSGDQDGAEREAHMIWREDPDGRPAMGALELLVRLLEGRDRKGAAEMLSMEARAHQPGDYANNRRLVQIYTAEDDPAKVVESLRAMASSGPFDAAEHIDLAHRLADLNRGGEMLNELAHAREIARIEGNAEQIKRVDDLIGAFRQRFSHGQGR